MTKVLVLNGPNLNRLGTREPGIYGSTTFAELADLCRAQAVALGLEADVRRLVDRAPHRLGAVPVILNPAAFTHYSYALRDACAMLTAPLIEVHISNPQAREEFRHTSVISGVATGTIAGFGIDSYRLALQALAAST